MAETISKQLQLRNQPGECEKLYTFLTECLVGLPVSEEFQHDLKLVSEEVFANIINHSLGDNVDTPIHIALTADQVGVRLTFEDAGEAFNPLTAAGAGVDTDDLSEGGMGLMLIKSLTDKQDYARENGHNVFTVIKHYNQ